jgi:uncharacterized membrane protein
MIRAFIIFGGVLIFLATIMNAAANWLEMQPSAPDQKFAVVDTYRGCSVVQYTPTNAARYTYFLDCKK